MFLFDYAKGLVLKKLKLHSKPSLKVRPECGLLHLTLAWAVGCVCRA